MTLSNLVRRHNRPLRAALVSSAVALTLSLGGGAAAFADDDGHDRKGRHGRDHHDRGDRYRGHDRGDDDDDGGYRYRSDRYRGRGHGDSGHRYRGDHRDRRDRRDYRHGYSYRGDDYRHGYYDRGHGRRFEVPRHINRGHYRDYDRYYRGSVFYSPHRHHHRVYYFPVIVNGYVDYAPHAYCGEAFYPGHYGHGGVRGHLGLHFDF